MIELIEPQGFPKPSAGSMEAVATLLEGRDTGDLPALDLPHDDLMQLAIPQLIRRAQRLFSNVVILADPACGSAAFAMASTLAPAMIGFPPGKGAPKKIGAQHQPGPLRLIPCTRPDPHLFAAMMQRIHLPETMFVVMGGADAGEGVQTLFALCQSELRRALGAKADITGQFLMVTDIERGPLRKLADEQHLPSLPIGTGVRAEHSLLAAVGLFPLVAAGIAVETLIEGAVQMDELLMMPAAEAPGAFNRESFVRIAALHRELSARKAAAQTLALDYTLTGVAEWRTRCVSGGLSVVLLPARETFETQTKDSVLIAAAQTDFEAFHARCAAMGGAAIGVRLAPGSSEDNSRRQAVGALMQWLVAVDSVGSIPA